MSEAWVLIHDGIDRQRDFAGDLYAQVGPEADGRWSWTLLRYNPDGDPEVLANGTAPDEITAKMDASWEAEGYLVFVDYLRRL